MLTDMPVLIVQDNIYLALDLAGAVEELDGRVVGPAATAAEALALLEKEQVAAALIDAELADGGVSPIVRALAERRLPFVIQASRKLAPEIMMIAPAVPVLFKPIQPLDVVSILAHELARRSPAARLAHPRLT
jgi:DNA-binding NtrC family response regulator